MCSLCVGLSRDPTEGRSAASAEQVHCQGTLSSNVARAPQVGGELRATGPGPCPRRLSLVGLTGKGPFCLWIWPTFSLWAVLQAKGPFPFQVSGFLFM